MLDRSWRMQRKDREAPPWPRRPLALSWPVGYTTSKSGSCWDLRSEIYLSHPADSVRSNKEDLQMSTTNLVQAIDGLSDRVRSGQIGSMRDWGGAGVAITSEPPPPRSPDSFYPDPRFVVTPASGKLSWLFTQLRDVFAPFLDYQNKYEFYGRLANSANRFLASHPDADASPLCLAVLEEAHAMAQQIGEIGYLDSLMVAIGNEILDDRTDRPT